MNYRIKWVPAEQMGDLDFILCNEECDGIVLYMNRRVRSMSDEDSAAVWVEAWAAFRELAHVGEIPPQRAYAQN